MGKYNSAIITNEGVNMFASAVGGGETVTFMTMQASSHAYPSSTDFTALTSLQDVEATVNVNYAGVYNNNVVQVSARFDNDGVTTAYLINTLGLFAKLGNGTPKLVAVISAVTPDQMPVYDANNPSAFIYNVQCTVQNASSIAVSVNPAGTVTVEQFNEEMATKLGATDNAVSATKLQTSRSLTVDLGSTTAASFDGSADASIGVMGELPIANGGTGANTQAGARSSLGVPPTSHAVANTTYGSGTATNYGHVKLSDTYNTVEANADAAHGVGASALAMQAGLASKIGTFEDQINNKIASIIHNTVLSEVSAYDEKLNRWFPIWQDVVTQDVSLTPLVQNLVIDSYKLFRHGKLHILSISFHFTQQTTVSNGISMIRMSSDQPFSPAGAFYALASNNDNQRAQLGIFGGGNTIDTWDILQSNATAAWSVQFTYFTAY